VLLNKEADRIFSHATLMLVVVSWYRQCSVPFKLWWCEDWL